MFRKLICLGLVLTGLVAFSYAAAEGVQIKDVTTQIGDNYVSYPQLDGLRDAAVQQRINDDIVLSSGVANHMVTLATLGGNPWRLQVEYRVCMLDEEIFSAVISARGKLPGKRDGHAWTALSYSLETGERLTLEDLFANPDEAVAQMETWTEASLSEELNGYMEYSALTPLPQDAFTLDETGITFWYPADQFSLLSGYSGAVQFWYEELDGLWKQERALQMTDDQIRQAVEQAVSDGKVPNVPAAMGEKLTEVTDAYRLLRTPDEFPGGRYFVLENPAFRSILVISDALEADDENAVVEGVQLKRGGLCGLRIGITSQADWRKILGDPLNTVTVTENMAYDYRLPEGQYDVYHFGENELRLHADESGMLCAIQLCKQ